MPDTEPAAALLTYRIEPHQVFAGSTTSLTFEIRNDTTSSVTFGEGDAVEVTFPAGEGEHALSRVVDYQARALTDGFTAGRVEGTATWRVRAAGFEARELLPGKAVLVRFDGVKVNGVKGEVTAPVLEQLEQEADSSVKVEKIPAELNVVAWLEEPVVGLGETTRLLWQSYGGTRVVVFAFADGVVDDRCPEGDRRPGYRCFPVSGEGPPWAGETDVSVPDETQEEKTYTVQVRAGAAHREARVTLTQHKPEITGFGAAPRLVEPTQPIGAMDEVPLLWRTIYGNRAFLQTPPNSAGRRVALNPAGPSPVTPGVDAFRSAPDRSRIPDTATYVLRVTGFRQPAEARLTYRLNPVRVLNYKYSKLEGETLSDPVWAVDPAGWPAVEEVRSTPPWTLTVYGPGGTKQVLYLGGGDTVHPQVRYFAATAGEGGKQTLRWVTANAAALRLEPVGYAVPTGQIAKGTYDVTPAQTTDYVLHATAAGGETVTSTLRVVVP